MSSMKKGSGQQFTVLAFLVLVTLWSVVVEGDHSNEYQDDDNDDDDDDAFTMSRLFLRGKNMNRRHRDLQSSTSTSTSVNIFTKLKESIGMTIVGIILICITPCLIWKNEQRHVMELSRIEYCKRHATEVPDVNAPSPASNDQLVHFTGAVQVGDDADHGLEFGNSDNNKNNNDKNSNDNIDKLNVTSRVPQALLLKRTCFIYQKFEDEHQETKRNTVGGGETRTTTYTLREDWTTTPQPEGQLPHLQPPQLNIRGNWNAIVQASGGDVSAAAADTAAATPATSAPPTPGLPRNMAEVMGAFMGAAADTSHPPHGHVVSPVAHVGGYALSKEVISLFPHVFASTDSWIPVPAEFIPQQIPGVESLVPSKEGNVLTEVVDANTGTTGQPKNGDVKIVYEYVLDGFDCSFIVRQVAAVAASTATATTTNDMLLFGVQKYPDVVDAKCLGLCKTDLGDVWMIQKGNHTLPEMIQISKQEEGTINKIMRIICWILLMAGWSMLFAPFVTALSVLPFLATLGSFAVFVVAFIVSCLCCNVVTLLAYLRFRPLMSGSLLALALGITGVVIWRLNIAAKTGGDEE